MNHVKQAALIGADVVTAPPATLKALVKHPLTDKGLEQLPRRLGQDRPEDRLRSSHGIRRKAEQPAFFDASSRRNVASDPAVLPCYDQILRDRQPQQFGEFARGAVLGVDAGRGRRRIPGAARRNDDGI